MPASPQLEPAFEAFFRATWRDAVAVGRRLLGDVAEAEDCAAEAFARAFAAWGKVSAMPHRRAWVLRVTSNVAIDRARRRARIDRVHDVADGTLGGDELEIAALRLSLLAALAQLSTRQREAIVLRHLFGMSEQETGTALGLSVNSVKKHTSRAMQRLRSASGRGIEEMTRAI
jgi:RNA polymerase sigma factor (sigma-70 family)